MDPAIDAVERLRPFVRFTDLLVTEAFDRMIVHHSCGLHERVADGAAYEIEAPFL